LVYNPELLSFICPLVRFGQCIDVSPSVDQLAELSVSVADIMVLKSVEIISRYLKSDDGLIGSVSRPGISLKPEK